MTPAMFVRIFFGSAHGKSQDNTNATEPKTSLRRAQEDFLGALFGSWLTLFPTLPSALFAFGHVGSGNQFWIESNVKIARAALRALLRTPAFYPYQCAAESFHDLIVAFSMPRPTALYRSRELTTLSTPT